MYKLKWHNIPLQRCNSYTPNFPWENTISYITGAHSDILISFTLSNNLTHSGCPLHLPSFTVCRETTNLAKSYYGRKQAGILIYQLSSNTEHIASVLYRTTSS